VTNWIKDTKYLKIGVLLQQARLKMGLTQQELAKRCRTNKGNISKIENDVREIRIATLQKNVEKGLDGELQFHIKLRQRSK